ncbi:MAG: LacI family transcriptional regulator [Candidatus Hydrogenedentes bacterium]|nr:LacI family transcriptional regulator [Candidatus Hydrogenedentota bacterium]
MTITDVARHVGYSPTAISFVLNKHPMAERIADATKQRILAAVEELGYVPNTYARLLRQSDVSKIVIICTDISDPFCAQVVQGIMLRLNKTNAFYQLADIQNSVTALESTLLTLSSNQVDGAIAILNTISCDWGRLVSLLNENTMFVSIGRIVPGTDFPSVTMDNGEGVRLALDHLYSLGHREIACIFGPPEIEDAVIRRARTLENFERLGLACPNRLTDDVTDVPVTSDTGVRAIQRILACGLPFTAVLTFDDYSAYGVIQELVRQGYRVPEDISVVGFDDIFLSRAYNPALTTIRHPMTEIGTAGAELLLESLARRKKGVLDSTPASLVLKPELVVRESTARPHK